MLRDYQRRAINQLYDWFSNNSGNPCLVLPTGSGKSHIIAALCKEALQNYPETRILVMTHVKELIEQNAEKMREHWPNAPMGIYSASIGIKQLDEPITFAGIQSIRDKHEKIGHIDLIIIDECHLVSHKNEGGYRALIENLKHINPRLKVIGLTATPYRLGHGLITDKPALFDALLEPVLIEELIAKKYLAPLRSKVTDIRYDLSLVNKRGGEYIESDLQKAVDNPNKNAEIIQEVLGLASDRKHWLFFCSGINHAMSISDELNNQGIVSDFVTGDMPQPQREQILNDFKSGKIRALTNANILTTGFDFPDIDLIVMLRPTLSPGLYVQMAGRGMRIKSHTDHCIVLDFAGVVQTHGPIIAVEPPRKSDGNGESPVKVCPKCQEICHASVSVCPACGHVFPERKPKNLSLHDVDIMGDSSKMEVTGWRWRRHVSKTSGKEMLAVSYYGALTDPSINEYLPVTHSGYAGQKAMEKIVDIATKSDAVKHGLDFSDPTLENIALAFNQAVPPKVIKYQRDGNFHRVITRQW